MRFLIVFPPAAIPLMGAATGAALAFTIVFATHAAAQGNPNKNAVGNKATSSGLAAPLSKSQAACMRRYNLCISNCGRASATGVADARCTQRCTYEYQQRCQ